jgi:hypothetical protein
MTRPRLTLGQEYAWAYWLPIALCALLACAALAAPSPRRGVVLLAASWALPVLLATWAVNPVLRKKDLFVRGEGHRAVDRALAERPGRLVELVGYDGNVLATHGWPILGSVGMAPDLSMFRFLAPDSPGLTEEVYNRYSHFRFTLPSYGKATVSAGGDDVVIPISPCSARLAALGVNHLLLLSDVRPDTCGDEFETRPAGYLQIWSRRRPVGSVGYSADRSTSNALAFDYRVGGSGERLVLEPGRDRMVVELKGPAEGAYAFPFNLSLVESISCEGATARTADAHVVVVPSGAGARCEVRYLDSWGALRRLARAR